MGMFIASTIFGFLVIPLVCMILAIPVFWSVIRDAILSHWRFILFTLILPKIIQPIIMVVVKKFLYGKEAVLHRALVSFFTFWQTFLSIPAGIVTGLIRFGICTGCLLLSMPQIHFAATPDAMNRFLLLDSAHKTYLS